MDMTAPTPIRFAAVALACAAVALATPLRGEPATPAPLSPASALDLADYRGRVVYLDFWASWCGPCRESFPWMNAMHARYAERGLTVIGVSVDVERADAERFLQRYPADFATLLDAAGELASRFDLPGMPTSFLFDRQGRQLSRHVGFRSKRKADMETAIRQALDTGKAPVAGKKPAAGKRPR